MTKFAPHKALKSIPSDELTFDERVVLHRVVGARTKSEPGRQSTRNQEGGGGLLETLLLLLLCDHFLLGHQEPAIAPRFRHHASGDNFKLNFKFKLKLSFKLKSVFKL